MNVSTITLTFQNETRICSCKDSDDDCDCELQTTTTHYILKAEENQIDFSGLMKIDASSDGVVSTLFDCLKMFMSLDQPDRIITLIEFEGGQTKRSVCDLNFLEKIMLSDKNAKNKYWGSGFDDDFNAERETYYVMYRHDVIKQTMIYLVAYAKRLSLLKRIEGIDCPVLNEPLKAGNVARFKKCDHLLSKEAYHKLTLKSGAKVCPLCRAEHYGMDVEFA